MRNRAACIGRRAGRPADDLGWWRCHHLGCWPGKALPLSASCWAGSAERIAGRLGRDWDTLPTGQGRPRRSPRRRVLVASGQTSPLETRRAVAGQACYTWSFRDRPLSGTFSLSTVPPHRLGRCGKPAHPVCHVCIDAERTFHASVFVPPRAPSPAKIRWSLLACLIAAHLRPICRSLRPGTGASLFARAPPCHPILPSPETITIKIGSPSSWDGRRELACLISTLAH